MSLIEQIEQCRARVAQLEFEIAVEKRLLERLMASEDEPWSIIEYLRAMLAEGVCMSLQQMGAALKQSKFGLGKTKLNRLASSAIRRRPDLFENVGWGLYKLRS